MKIFNKLENACVRIQINFFKWLLNSHTALMMIEQQTLFIQFICCFSNIFDSLSLWAEINNKTILQFQDTLCNRLNLSTFILNL